MLVKYGTIFLFICLDKNHITLLRTGNFCQQMDFPEKHVCSILHLTFPMKYKIAEIAKKNNS